MKDFNRDWLEEWEEIDQEEIDESDEFFIDDIDLPWQRN